MKTKAGFVKNCTHIMATSAICASAVLTASGVAVAQPNEQATLEEIIVQAQRKTQSLQKVPISVMAFTNDQISSKAGLNLKALDHMIPNVIIEHVSIFPLAASLSVRGVGYAGIESFTDPNVAVYINGVYQARNAIALNSSLDVEAIEVLRGPQGTLYGRNAFAGAIAMRTNRPDMDDTSGSARVTVGNYGRQDGEFVVNLPIDEGKVAARVAARLFSMDGFYKNNGIIDSAGTVDQTLKGENFPGQKSLYVRPSLRFTPNESWDVTFYGEIYRERSEPGPAVLGPLDGNLLAALGWPGKNPFGDKKFGVSGDGSDPYEAGMSLGSRPTDVDTYVLTNETTYKSDAGTFKGIFNYQHTTEDIWTDTDGSNVNAFSSARFQTYKAYSAELQYLSTITDVLDVTAGVFYLHDDYNTTQLTFTDFSVPFVTAFTPFTVNPSYINNEGKRNSWSIYAQLEYHVTDLLSVVAGGRYSYEKKYGVRGENTSLSAAGFLPTIDFSDHLFSTVPGVVFGPVKNSWDNFAPRAGVNYEATDDIMLFAFWQRAYKSGGFNANSTDLTAFITPYGEEKVDNFEAGVKSEWLDGKLRVNVNGFYSKFTGLQRSLVTPSPTSSSGVTTVVTNAADLKSYGLETELSALVADKLTVFANIGWNKAYYTSYCADLDGAAPTQTPASGRSVCGPITAVGANFLVPTDYSDLDPIRAPRWDITAGFSKEFLVDGGSINLNGRMNYRSSMYVNLLNVKYSYRPSMLTLDASISWMPESERYSVTLWGTNLTKEVEIMNFLPVATLFSAINPTEPRTYGVTVGMKF